MAPQNQPTADRLGPPATVPPSQHHRDLEWHASALCAETDPEAFFPDRGESPRAAIAVCLRCEVRRECLAYALTNDERFGVWGGMTARQRRRLRRETARAVVRELAGGPDVTGVELFGGEAA